MNSPSPGESPDPLYQEALARFARLLHQAGEAGDPEPTAMTLATGDGAGRIAARIVLLKGVDEHGFRFFTNYLSDKGRQLALHDRVALCFHWKTLGESGVQVRVEGRARRLPEAASDVYFASRPRGSQLGAWASLQSEPLPDRSAFQRRLDEVTARYQGGPVPRPPHWGGFVIRPARIEFWHGAGYRLHERRLYQETADGSWTVGGLYP